MNRIQMLRHQLTMRTALSNRDERRSDTFLRPIDSESTTDRISYMKKKPRKRVNAYGAMIQS
jgi:hypothetical protein